MKLYVAGPMTGLPEFNFPAFADAAARLRARGFHVLSAHEVALPCGCRSALRPCGDGGHEYTAFLRADLAALLGHAQGIALLPGWEDSRGAKLEVYVADFLGIEVAPVDEWLAREVWAA